IATSREVAIASRQRQGRLWLYGNKRTAQVYDIDLEVNGYCSRIGYGNSVGYHLIQTHALFDGSRAVFQLTGDGQQSEVGDNGLTRSDSHCLCLADVTIGRDDDVVGAWLDGHAVRITAHGDIK